MIGQFIPVAAPALTGNEKEYVMDCLDSTWISSSGKYVRQFEETFARFCHVPHALSCSNGTVALHLALLALGVKPGDEVIVPTLSFIATANAVTYCGARPVFVDSEPETWNLDPALIEEKITPRTKGIIAVHLYGHPADMDPILNIARRHGLFVIEDAAEAHGARYKGRPVGSLGDMATFSFFGNKILTTGEGGMVVTHEAGLAEQVRQLKEHGMDPIRRYWYSMIGYNYRMTNIAAAIGCAQLEQVEGHLRSRADIASWYQEELRDVRYLTWQPEQDWARHVRWMFTVLLNEESFGSRDTVMANLHEQGIETRPVFYPMHDLPPYRHLSPNMEFPVAVQIGQWGMSLPTGVHVTREDVKFICETLAGCVEKHQE